MTRSASSCQISCRYNTIQYNTKICKAPCCRGFRGKRLSRYRNFFSIFQHGGRRHLGFSEIRNSSSLSMSSASLVVSRGFRASSTDVPSARWVRLVAGGAAAENAEFERQSSGARLGRHVRRSALPVVGRPLAQPPRAPARGNIRTRPVHRLG